MSQPRETWSSNMGFILAATGSAIGLGNLWKFPFITWENNGGAFVLLYLMCIVAVGLPIMMAELLIGRKMKASASPEPSMVSALTRSRTRITNRIGREIRAIRSIPPCTPEYTIPTVAAMNSPERRNWRPPFPVTSVKKSPV